MFKNGSSVYGLKYNSEKVNVFEQSVGRGFLELLRRTNGIMPLQELKVLFTLGLIDAKDGTSVPQEESAKLFEEIIKRDGYIFIQKQCLDKVVEDCPFLFR